MVGVEVGVVGLKELVALVKPGGAITVEILLAASAVVVLGVLDADLVVVHAHVAKANGMRRTSTTKHLLHSLHALRSVSSDRCGRFSFSMFARMVAMPSEGV